VAIIIITSSVAAFGRVRTLLKYKIEIVYCIMASVIAISISVYLTNDLPIRPSFSS